MLVILMDRTWPNLQQWCTIRPLGLLDLFHQYNKKDQF
jgi:hypothetical protein